VNKQLVCFHTLLLTHMLSKSACYKKKKTVRLTVNVHLIIVRKAQQLFF